MKHLFRKPTVQIAGAILSAVSLAIAVIFGVLLAALLILGCFEDGDLFPEAVASRAWRDADSIMNGYFDPLEPTKPWVSYYDGGIYTGEDSNFRYDVVDNSTGYSVLYTVEGGEKICFKDSATHCFETPKEIPQEDTYTVIDSTFLCGGVLFSYDAEFDIFQQLGDFGDNNYLSDIPEYPYKMMDEGFAYNEKHYAYDNDGFYPAPQTAEVVYTTKDYTITYYLLDGLPYNDEYRQLYLLTSAAENNRFLILGIFLVSFLLWVILTCVLCKNAGRRPEQEEPRMPLLLRLPTDVVLVAAVLGLCLCISLLDNVYYGAYLTFKIVFTGGLSLAAAAIVTYTLLLLAARINTRTLISGSVIGWCLKHLRDWARSLKGLVLRLLEYLPLVWKVILCYAIICFAEFIFLMMDNTSFVIMVLWVLEKLVLGALVGYVTLCFRTLKDGAESIAEGDYDYYIDADYMVLDFKDTANTLNHIQDGINTAVEYRMRSERMKTELITNVSHDLKTPLTSIVSYVDLLKQEPMGSEAAKEYLDVLDRQSQRLKKLITDLVEASKASTGNITVNKESLDVTTLLGQAMGEYRERLTEADITPVVKLPAKAVMVEADGRLLWRVFDNLLGNVVKYAMPGTRFYLTLSDELGVKVTFRNISREPLEVSASELTERFVRGDQSRHTDGSGLGLSIAKSLTEAMGGDFDLDVDGDLFKVSVYLQQEYGEELPF